VQVISHNSILLRYASWEAEDGFAVPSEWVGYHIGGGGKRRRRAEYIEPPFLLLRAHAA
jgi:hypothetical protein